MSQTRLYPDVDCADCGLRVRTHTDPPEVGFKVRDSGVTTTTFLGLAEVRRLRDDLTAILNQHGKDPA